MSAVLVKLDPLVSEFETTAQEVSYNRWITQKIQTSLDDPRPVLAHDDVMAKMDALIAQSKQQRQVA